MYHTHFLRNDPTKANKCKIYSNMLNWIKTDKQTHKKEYYLEHFQMCKDNLKAAWKLMGTLIKSKNKRLAISKQYLQL